MQHYLFVSQLLLSLLIVSALLVNTSDCVDNVNLTCRKGKGQLCHRTSHWRSTAHTHPTLAIPLTLAQASDRRS